MEYRRVAKAGLVVSELSLGTATFAGVGDFFGAWGDTDVDQARRLIDLSLEAGINVDTADVYSDRAAEKVQVQALRGRREDVLISTNASWPTGPGDWSSSSRARCGTRADPSFSGRQLVKSASLANENRRPRCIAHQVHYSLIGRDQQWELMPLGIEEGVGAIVSSPLGCGRLTGRIRRGQPLPERGRRHVTAAAGPPVNDEQLYAIVDVLGEIAAETGRTRAAQRAELAATQADGVLGNIADRDESQLRKTAGGSMPTRWCDLTRPVRATRRTKR